MFGDWFTALDVLEVFANGASFLGTEMIDKKFSVEMVNLVQDGASQQSPGLEFKRLVIEGTRLDPDTLGA